jgi:hypothetical protein|tara:strand:+ start:518 stop:778 length:261 start_codon:yes stop_codon:yes gene_type:complete
MVCREFNSDSGFVSDNPGIVPWSQTIGIASIDGHLRPITGGPDSDTPDFELTKAARTTFARLIKKVYNEWRSRCGVEEVSNLFHSF